MLSIGTAFAEGWCGIESPGETVMPESRPEMRSAEVDGQKRHLISEAGSVPRHARELQLVPSVDRFSHNPTVRSRLPGRRRPGLEKVPPALGEDLLRQSLQHTLRGRRCMMYDLQDHQNLHLGEFLTK